MNWPMSVFPSPDPNRLHIFPTRPPPPAQPARPPLPHNLAHPHKQFILRSYPRRDSPTSIPAPGVSYILFRLDGLFHFCVSVVLVAHSQVENNTISHSGRMLHQIIATLVFLFLSRFRQTLFFQREKRCDNRYSTNGGASTWRQRTWSRGNASTQCHSSGNYWTSGFILYCGCSSPGEFDVSKTGVEVMSRFKCRGSGSLKLFVQPFCGIIGCRTRVTFVNCYRSVRWSCDGKLYYVVCRFC